MKKKKFEAIRTVFRQNSPLIPLGCAARICKRFSRNRRRHYSYVRSLVDDKKEKQDTRDLFAETAIVTLVFSLVSAVIYFIRGTVPLTGSFQYFIPALAGGGIGALLLDKLPSKLLKRIFAAVVIVAGVIMIFR